MNAHEYDWHWNEFQQVGTNYESDAEVAAYDMRMRKFRDVDAENEFVFEKLHANPESSLLEIGTGTGSFARMAAKKTAHVTALDVSESMLHYAHNCARSEGLENIEFIRSGFLSFDAQEAQFDGIVSGLALHHLPDLWKSVALRNIFRWLRPGGRFVLIDVVFDWGVKSPENYFSQLIEQAPGSQNNFAHHIGREYSTFHWIMCGLLERSGFVIEETPGEGAFCRIYVCRKP